MRRLDPDSYALFVFKCVTYVGVTLFALRLLLEDLKGLLESLQLFFHS